MIFFITADHIWGGGGEQTGVTQSMNLNLCSLQTYILAILFTVIIGKHFVGRLMPVILTVYKYKCHTGDTVHDHGTKLGF